MPPYLRCVCFLGLRFRIPTTTTFYAGNASRECLSCTRGVDVWITSVGHAPAAATWLTLRSGVLMPNGRIVLSCLFETRFMLFGASSAQLVDDSSCRGVARQQPFFPRKYLLKFTPLFFPLLGSHRRCLVVCGFVLCLYHGHGNNSSNSSNHLASSLVEPTAVSASN